MAVSWIVNVKLLERINVTLLQIFVSNVLTIANVMAPLLTVMWKRIHAFSVPWTQNVSQGLTIFAILLSLNAFLVADLIQNVILMD